MRFNRRWVLLLSLIIPAACTGSFGAGQAARDASGDDASDDHVIPVIIGPDGSPADSTMPIADASSADASGADAPTDSPTPPPLLACTLAAGTQFVVDDLSTLGGSVLTFVGSSVRIARQLGTGAYVFAQRAADSTEFFQYEVDFVAKTATPTPVPGLGTTVSLLDVASVGSTNEALAAFSSSGSNGALEIVPLSFNGGTPAPAWALANATMPVGSNISGKLLHGAQADSYLVGENTTTTYAVVAGQGSMGDSGASVTLLQSGAPQVTSVKNAPLVTIGGTTYTALPVIDAGLTEIAFPADASTAGSSTPVAVSGSGVMLGMQVDPSHVANVEAIALTLPDIQLWGGSVPQSSLVPLSIAPPQLTQGSVLTAADLPSLDSIFAWWGSDLVVFGPAADQSGSLVLLWIDPTGRALSRATTSGKLLTTNNPVTSSAVQVLGQLGQTTASLAIAWVERITPDSGPQFDRLYAAEVTCSPTPVSE